MYLAYIGSTKVAFLKAKYLPTQQVEIEALSARLAGGFEGGMVKHLGEASETLSAVVKDVISEDSKEVISCRAVVSNSNLKSYLFESSIYFHGDAHAITLKDVRDVIAQTRSVATVPLKEVIVQAIPQEFLVDDLAGVQNPIGLEASRLGVTLRLLTLSFSEHNNLARVFERCELDVTEMIPSVLAAGNSVLHPDEKQEGVVLVVVGGTATQFAVYRNSVLADVRTIPTGSDCITEVLEKNLSISYLDAQRVKEAFGSAIPKTEFEDELIPIPDPEGKTKYHINRREFESHIQTGLTRFFEALLSEISNLRLEGSLPNQFVFSGGGVQMDGFLERLKEAVSPAVRIGIPIGYLGPESLMGKPAFSAAIGGVNFTSKISNGSLPLFGEQHWAGRLVHAVRSWIFEYF
ncbi:MAG: cell division protein FtsA [Omnitrophica bacterium RIFCSPLOWO2_01_FULL_50_24]|nr:MAG: cell division protein FtsA [Omnitrophica bacterium RIFCSPLOWO2_01_FULL_50_24]